jgi:hypothetical protein
VWSPSYLLQTAYIYSTQRTDKLVRSMRSTKPSGGSKELNTGSKYVKYLVTQKVPCLPVNYYYKCSDKVEKRV